MAACAPWRRPRAGKDQKESLGSNKKSRHTADKSIEIEPSSGRARLGRAGLETLKDKSGGVRGQDEGSRAN